MDSEKEKSKQKSYVFGPNNKEIRKKSKKLIYEQNQRKKYEQNQRKKL